MKIIVFLVVFIISLASCEIWLPDEAKDALPFENHPKLRESLKANFPQLFNDEETEDGEAGKKPFIVGGTVASLGQFPYQVLLNIITKEGVYLCGGSLLRHNLVLTAAHCVDVKYDRIVVYVGVVNSFIGPAQWGTNVTSSSDVKIHEKYSERDGFLNDIALIRLRNAPENLLSLSYVGNISLPVNHTSNNLVGQMGTVSGFGRYSDSPLTGQSQFLKYVNLPVVSNSVCEQVFGFNRESLLCVATTTTAATCQGDSGGPLTMTLNGEHVIVGIVSFGAAAGCELGYPAGFTRVTSFINWIERNASPRSTVTNVVLLFFIQIFIYFRK